MNVLNKKKKTVYSIEIRSRDQENISLKGSPDDFVEYIPSYGRRQV